VSRTSKRPRPQRVRVGTRVRYHFPMAWMDAEVIEDRGFVLGDDGQVVRIRAVEETDFPSEFDVPVRMLEILGPPGEGRAA
jgi:hypothetical protein